MRKVEIKEERAVRLEKQAEGFFFFLFSVLSFTLKGYPLSGIPEDQ